MYSSYFAKFFFFIWMGFGSLFLWADVFSKGVPAKDSLWPALWVQDCARIRPIEAAGFKWWQSLEPSVSPNHWSKKEVGQSLEAWQIWLGVYFSDKEERKALHLIRLDPVMAQSLELESTSLYSLNEIEKAEQNSPHWSDFTRKLILEAFSKEKLSTNRFQTSSRRTLSAIDEKLSVYADDGQLKITQSALHPFLKEIPLSLKNEKPTPLQNHASHLRAWQNFIERCAKIGVFPGPNQGANLLKLPLFIDSAKSSKWHEPSEVFLNEKAVLGVSKEQWRQLFSLWKKEPDKAWTLLAQYAHQSQHLLAEQSKEKVPSNIANFLERVYFNTPLLPLVILGYFLTAFAKWLHLHRVFSIFSLLSWSFHSALLLTRVIILNRPPVSNMEETVLYVPWVAITLAVLLQLSGRKNTDPLALLYAICASLLGAIFFFGAEPGLEVVPAVLNSQFWLTIHVLMVVGSYAFFLAASAISHTQLLKLWKGSSVDHTSMVIGSMALGTLLLTCGTLLGAVWAAQSWGRFWDWDPKESWAFISCCLYLLIFHAWAFKKISANALHLLSIAGFWVISFTWYGVNFVIATGLHSYGFGTSSYTWIYLSLLLIDAVVLALIFFRMRFFSRSLSQRK